MDVISLIDSTVPAATEAAVYSCSMTNLWTSERHPALYPTGPAHWTRPLLTSHNSNFEMWSPGTLASEAAEDLAEFGSTIALRGLIENSTDTGMFVQGSDFDTDDVTTTSQTFDDLTFMPGFSLLSTMTMVAPSPDWFTGIYNFDAINQATGTYYDSFIIDTYPWDAGTETGSTYTISNPAEVQHVPIFQLTVDTVPDTGVFLNPDGTDVLPVSRWNCVMRTTDDDNNMVTDAPQTEPTMAPVLAPTTVQPPPVDMDTPACEGNLAGYLAICTMDNDCCSNNCRRNVCRAADASLARGEDSRLSNGLGVGGAASRPRGGGRQRSLLRGTQKEE
jgi:Spondin_N